MSARSMVVRVGRTDSEVDEGVRSLDGARTLVVRPRTGESIGDALHQRLAGAAIRGGVIGGIVVGVLSGAVAALLARDLATAGGLALAVALTGGPFVGALAGFSHAMHLNDRIGRLLGTDLDLRDARLLVAWVPVGDGRTGTPAGGSEAERRRQPVGARPR